jgi:membrane-associated phospholipid phosphatase
VREAPLRFSRLCPRFVYLLLIFLSLSCSAYAQFDSTSSDSASDSPAEGIPSPQGVHPDCSLKRLDKCLVNVAADQAGIWTSPLRVRANDMLWLLPFGAAVGVSIYYDPQTMQAYGSPERAVNFGYQVSRFSSPYVSFGAAGSMYLLGAAFKSPRLKHAGLLGSEAVVDAVILTEGLKLATNRDRPNQGNGMGDFWPHGTRSYNLNSSMPSNHAAAAWALARVVSSEFSDKRWLQFLCYGAASTVSAARVLSRDHFPSDVIVGSTFGFLVGGYVERHRSDQYWDSIASSVHPVFDRASRSYSIALAIPLSRIQKEE